jgi:hypothetical protein
MTRRSAWNGFSLGPSVPPFLPLVFPDLNVRAESGRSEGLIKATGRHVAQQIEQHSLALGRGRHGHHQRKYSGADALLLAAGAVSPAGLNLAAGLSVHLGGAALTFSDAPRGREA